MTPAQRVRVLRGIIVAAGVIGFVLSFVPSLPPWAQASASGVVAVAGAVLGTPVVEIIQRAIRLPEQTPPPQSLTEAARTIGEGE